MAEFEKKKKTNNDNFEKFKQQQESKEKLIKQSTEKVEMDMFGGLRDKLIIGVIGVLWVSLVFYSNYTDMFSRPKIEQEPMLQEK